MVPLYTFLCDFMQIYNYFKMKCLKKKNEPFSSRNRQGKEQNTCEKKALQKESYLTDS